MTPAIESILSKAMGLNSASIGSATVMRAVRRRMELCRAASDAAYLALLDNSPEELQALIDEVSVPETWFFRDLQPFRLLAEHVAGEWSEANAGRVLRILSAPCSSGEEAYSIAMVLRDAGLDGRDYRIDAIDISARSIARAKLGIYGRNSFRGDEGDARERHFSPAGDGYVLHESIRAAVNFRCGNLLDGQFLSGVAAYDIVFCRNLLIYFDRATQRAALYKLHGLLAANGLLFLGHAEGGSVNSRQFAAVRRKGTFAYRKKNLPNPDHAPAPPEPADPERPARRAAAPKKVHAPAAPKPIEKDRTTPAAQPQVESKEAQLLEAQRLADRGQLAEAAALCEDYLLGDACSASAYHLLGVVREAEGQSHLAVDLFHKAVYLDPKHYQALVHLAMHAERRGDAKTAKAYRARAQRAQPAGDG